MSRYTGARLKKARALGVELPGLTRGSIERRPYPPGQHGHGRKKQTEYGIRLKEKQKLRFNFGISERQLTRLVKEAQSGKGHAGDKLIEMVERRLDNVIFRTGWVRTIPAARQLVNHGHILVNGKRVDIPSFRVEVGQVLSLRERSKELAIVKESLASPHPLIAPWLQGSEDGSFRVTDLPTAATAGIDLQLQLIIEYYSQRV